MKRADITEIFPEATKEQIDKLMGINGADINAAKADVDSLRKQLTESSAKEIADAQKQIESLTAELNGMKTAESIRLVREKVAAEKKVPASLLSGETEEVCAKQADDILAFAQPKYPSLKDGGEVSNPPTNTTRDKFAAWANENI